MAVATSQLADSKYCGAAWGGAPVAAQKLLIDSSLELIVFLYVFLDK